MTTRQSDGEQVPQTALRRARPRPDPVEAIAWLRQAAVKLAASADPDLERLAAAIEGYDAARGATTLDAQCGVTGGSGAGTWWRVEDREQRNAVLRQLQAECFAGVDVGEVATEIIDAAIVRRSALAAPGSRKDALLDAALQVGSLPRRRQLRAILRGNSHPPADCTDGIPT